MIARAVPQPPPIQKPPSEIKKDRMSIGGPTTEVPGLIYIHNGGGGILNWSIAIDYQNGSGWLLVGDDSGQNDATARVWAKPPLSMPWSVVT